MKKNVGTVDAMIRLSLGFLAFGWGVSRMTRRGGRGLLLTFLGAQKIAEGITRFCPLSAMMGWSTRDGLNQERKMPPSTTYFARRKVESPAPVPPQAQEEQERGTMNE
jgi:hypothetical protein